MAPVLAFLLALLSAGQSPAQSSFPPPAFTDPQRPSKLKAAFPEIEKILTQWAEQRKVPGMSWGLVIDGETALIKTMGYREWTSKQPVEEGTPFRIASMTKSFTALAILKLRDEGKLSLDDEVARWIPEVSRFRYPTTDTAPLRVRQLLTHSAGFPEDNPWGDRHLSLPFDELTAWLSRGMPWSTPPDTGFEYSNFGFGMLGRIVERVSGRTYREYLDSEILKPLGMTHSTLEPAEAKGAAVGYRREAGGDYRVEPSLPHGAFGAMGGLVTTAADLGRYVAFHLSAYPPRDGAEAGPVRRSSVREMHRLWRMGGFSVRRDQPPPAGDARLMARAAGYGYGLGVTSDCRFTHIVSHGGGLPGFGSHMMWLPEYGVGIFGMTNLTYSSPAPVFGKVWEAMQRTGGLQARQLPPSPVLVSIQKALFDLWNEWKPAAAERIAASNLFMDQSAAVRQTELAALQKTVGRCELSGPVRAENWLRGEFDLACERGSLVRMNFTLAPTMPEPTVQFWAARSVQPFGPAMKKAAERAAAGKLDGFKPRMEALVRNYGACKLGAVVSGDGVRQGAARLDCARGMAELELELDTKGRPTRVGINQPGGVTCAP